MREHDNDSDILDDDEDEEENDEVSSIYVPSILSLLLYSHNMFPH